MTKGYSLHVGLNTVDPTKYDGWSGNLDGCENDAESMRAICIDKCGFHGAKLLTQAVTAERVLDYVKEVADKCKPGDIFVFTSSSHGGQVDDPWKRYDQVSTICMYDREIISHELYELWGKFKKGVRIVMFSDSCHSGTIARLRYEEEQAVAGLPGSGVQHHPTNIRLMPWPIAQSVHTRNAEFIKTTLAKIPPTPKAGIIQLGACQDNQTAADGSRNGLFTEYVLKAWDNGAFAGDYPRFHKAIMKGMPSDQTPSWLTLGKVTKAFLEQKPFTV